MPVASHHRMKIDPPLAALAEDDSQSPAAGTGSVSVGTRIGAFLAIQLCNSSKYE
jgi:hypothetical protein